MFDPGSILKSNATRHDRAIEKAIRLGKPDLTSIAQLMNPQTCPAHLLGWLAWAFSVDVWEAHWSETTKRAVIQRSIEIHRIKGTVGAVRRALSSIGFRTDISEWFEYGGQPHTFRIDAFSHDVLASGQQIDAALVAMVTRLVENVKPVRSHFSLRIGESFNVSAVAQNGLRQTMRHRHDMTPQPSAHSVAQIVMARSGLRQRMKHRHDMAPQPGTQHVNATFMARVGVRMRARHRATHAITPRTGALYGL